MDAPTASRADIIERIRNAESRLKVYSALTAYIGSLPRVAAIPQCCLRLPLEGTNDIERRMTALAGAVDLASQNLRDRDCSIAKRALRVFAAATWRLRARRRAAQ